MVDIHLWAGLLLVAGLFVCIFELGGIRRASVRGTAALLCVALTARYFYWRVHFSLPAHAGLLSSLFSYFFLLLETGSLLSSCLTCFFMSRTVSRSAIADARQNSPLLSAPVDIFIATYNESYPILERTAVAALAVDHPDLRVWLLDDGNRAWVKDLADSLGVHYVARSKGKHAKAGNVNNGLKHALATGRRPEFFLLLDADFAANGAILRRTLGLFEDADVGIVQTPQHFFNPDPVQTNLLCSSVWPDEQRLFFNSLLPSKDAWGAAFCCGTSAVFRVAAFEAAGGMATETVTEDMLTSFSFDAAGYRTIFLNERLSLGLAPESIDDFLSQRTRWCLGAIQQIFTRWSFLGRGPVRWINRLSFLDTILYWIFGSSYKLMVLIVPMVWWLTGVAAIEASLPDLLFWMGPMVTAQLLFMGYLSEKRSLPVISDVTQILTAFVICRTVVTALIRPFGRPFKVTAKGISTTGVSVHWNLLWPFAFIASFTVGGMVVNVARYSAAHGSTGYASAILWTLLNTTLLTLAALSCVQVPHRRLDERFAVDEAATVSLVSFREGSAAAPHPPDAPLSLIPCTIQDISLGGAALLCPGGWQGLLGPARLQMSGGPNKGVLSLPFTVVDRRGDLLTLHFHAEPWIRRSLIRKLFTGDYHKDIERIRVDAVLRAFFLALLGPAPTRKPKFPSPAVLVPEAVVAREAP